MMKLGRTWVSVLRGSGDVFIKEEMATTANALVAIAPNAVDSSDAG
ncbi:MAG: hypothetical protein R3E39_27895 [Anaerolineae bacterium]